MSRAALRLGTRRSPMAMAQSQLVAARDHAADRARSRARRHRLGGRQEHGELLTQIGGTGVFVSSLRTSLLAGQVDFAVHSLKDLPTRAADGIVLAAVPAGDDPRDALIGPRRRQAGRSAARRDGSGPARRAGPRSC